MFASVYYVYVEWHLVLGTKYCLVRMVLFLERSLGTRLFFLVGRVCCVSLHIFLSKQVTEVSKVDIFVV